MNCYVLYVLQRNIKVKYKFHPESGSVLALFPGTLTIPASPRHDQVGVDVANEILPSGLPAVKAPYRLLFTRFLLLFHFGPRHANVLGQEVNEHLRKSG